MISDREFLLAEIAELRNGAGIKQENFSESGVPLIKISNFTSNSIDMHGATFVDREHAKKWNHHRLEKDDVLIATVGSWPPNWNSVVGKVVRTPEAAVGGIQNQNTVCVIPNEEIVNKDYLYYKLKSLEFLHWVSNIAQGSANQARVAVQKLGKYSLMLPSLRVQKTIGHILRVLDEKIEINHQTNRTLEQIAQAIFKSWFVDFEPVKAKIAALEAGGSEDDALLAAMQVISGSALFATDTADADAQTQLARLQAEHPEQYTTLRATAELFPSAMQESDLGEIPEGWVVSQIGDEVTVVGGGTPSTKNPEFWEGGTINWTTPKDLSNQVDKMLIDTDRRITQAGLNRISSGLLPVDTVLMSSRAPVGYLALAKTPIAVNQGYIAMKCEQTLSPEFVIQWCEVNMAEIKNRASGTTFAEISKKSFNIIPVLVPQESLISVYSKHIHQLYLKIEMSVRENKTLAELRDTLLPKLLSGELSISSAFTGQESCT